MGIMDELDAEGGAQTADTAEYMLRAPAIVNALISELKILTGEYDDWLPVESLDDLVRRATRATRSARCPTASRRTCSWTRTRAPRASTSSAMRSCGPITSRGSGRT